MHAPAQKRERAERHSQAAASLPAASRLLASAAACVVLAASAPTAAHAFEGAQVGAELFKGNCAGCHTGGGNVIAAGQTLKQGGALPAACIGASEPKLPSSEAAVSASDSRSRSPSVSADLERNGLTDVTSVSDIIANGKVPAPCPSRLTTSSLRPTPPPRLLYPAEPTAPALPPQRKMPGYGEACAPRGQCTFGPRLSAADIDMLAAFVLARSPPAFSHRRSVLARGRVLALLRPARGRRRRLAVLARQGWPGVAGCGPEVPSFRLTGGVALGTRRRTKQRRDGRHPEAQRGLLYDAAAERSVAWRSERSGSDADAGAGRQTRAKLCVADGAAAEAAWFAALLAGGTAARLVGRKHTHVLRLRAGCAALRTLAAGAAAACAGVRWHSFLLVHGRASIRPATVLLWRASGDSEQGLWQCMSNAKTVDRRVSLSLRSPRHRRPRSHWAAKSADTSSMSALAAESSSVPFMSSSAPNSACQQTGRDVLCV